jgi:hypothetical protein
VVAGHLVTASMLRQLLLRLFLRTAASRNTLRDLLFVMPGLSLTMLGEGMAPFAEGFVVVNEIAGAHPGRNGLKPVLKMAVGEHK